MKRRQDWELVPWADPYGEDIPHPAPHRAYEDPEFLQSPEARTVRVLSELLEPQHRLRRRGITDTIVFFGSARIPGEAHDTTHGGLAQLTGYYEAARDLAARLTAWNIERAGARQFVVCSGGGPGIMEAVNRGAADAGGESIGFGIHLPEEQALNPYVSEALAFEFHYFFMRKFWFLYNAKTLVFFPGGFGTMDEMMEILTLVQTQRVRKKMGIVLYGSDFWRSVVDFDAMARHGVISEEDLALFQFTDSVDEAFEVIRTFLEQNYESTLLDEE
ncbi:MAG: lysine decarboxylase [Dehalococcoidia bacterium]|nr:lysine decarboxylase [Dehalococcoidia bacterium]